MMAAVKYQHWFETLEVVLLYPQPCSYNMQLILSSFTKGCILYMFCIFSNNSIFSSQIECCLTPSQPSPQFNCKSLHVRKVCCQTQLLNQLFVNVGVSVLVLFGVYAAVSLHVNQNICGAHSLWDCTAEFWSLSICFVYHF